MKKIIFTIYLLSITATLSYSQTDGRVGINTDSPESQLHIHKKGATNTADDVFFDIQEITSPTIPSTSTFKSAIGVGKSQPTASLDVVGSVRLLDGTEVNGAMLVSDADGKASWHVRPKTDYKEGALHDTSTSIPLNVITDITQNTLDLEPGKWLVYVRFTAKSTHKSSSFEGPNQAIWMYLYNETLNKYEGLSSVMFDATKPDADGYYIATPQFFSLVTVPDSAPAGYRYRIRAKTSVDLTSLRPYTSTDISGNTGYGPFEFNAVKIDNNY